MQLMGLTRAAAMAATVGLAACSGGGGGRVGRGANLKWTYACDFVRIPLKES